MGRLIPLAGAAALLCGCYNGPGAASPDETTPYPPGVAVASPAPSPSGMWTLQTDGHYSCCWLGGDASFAVTVPSGGKLLRATVFLPDFGPYDKRPQTLAIGVDAAQPKTYANLRSGIYDLDVPLAPRSEAYEAIVHVKASYAWTPIALHISGDGRELSVELKGVRVL